MRTPLFFYIRTAGAWFKYLTNSCSILDQNENPTILFYSTALRVIQVFDEPTLIFELKWKPHHSFSPDCHARDSSIWPTNAEFWTNMRTPLFSFTQPPCAWFKFLTNQRLIFATCFLFKRIPCSQPQYKTRFSHFWLTGHLMTAKLTSLKLSKISF